METNTLLTPQVFIDVTEVNDNEVTVYYHLKNDSTNWISRQNILENINVYIVANQTSSKESLLSLKNRTKIINNSIQSSITIPYTTGTLNISAFCGNDNIRGESVEENIFVDGKINSSSYNSSSFSYINKNLDFRILQLEEFTTGSAVPTYSDATSNNFFISYNEQKKANIAYVFDIEKFLYENSAVYAALASNEYYKNLIFEKTSLASSDIIFYKKNITTNLDSNYTKINSRVRVLKSDVNNLSSSYILTVTDDNKSIYNYMEYAVALRINVQDYSYKVFKDEISSKIDSSIDYLNSYKKELEQTLNESLTDDRYLIFFRKKYLKDIQKIKTLIQDMSLIYSFVSKKYSRNEYMTLITSVLHPLITRVELIEKLITSFVELSANLQTLHKSVNPIDVNIDSETNNIGNIFYKEFKSTNLEGKEFYNSIDYGYQAKYGYDIFSMDTISTRMSRTYNGLQTYTQVEKDARRNMEYKKYFFSPPSLISGSDYFAPSLIDVGSKSYNLMLDLPQDTALYNEIFIRVKQYNNSEPHIKTPEYYYLDLFKSGVYVKNIGNKLNNSNSRAFNSVLFDVNGATSNPSLEYITNTGINLLYFVMDETKFLDIPKNIIHYIAAYPRENDNTVGNFLLNDEVKSNPEAKSKIIIWYNSIYKDELVFSGNSYDIYSLEEEVVHEMFTKRLKLYNKYYILQKTNIEVPLPAPATYARSYIIKFRNVDTLEKEMKLNVKSSLYNRNVKNSELLISISDI